MKIVFLCRLFYPHIGGVEKHVMEISERLIKKGHSVSIITEQYDKSLPVFVQMNGIAVYRINVGMEDKLKKFRVWKEMFRLQKVIQETDIIHCHDVFFWYLPFRFIYSKKPVYTTFHGYESYPITKGAIRMRKLSEKLSWGNICIGDFINKWYGTKPSYVSYGAVTIQSSKYKAASMKKDSAVFIGRLDEQTGILAYAKTIEILKKKYPKFDFTIVGDGEYRRKLEKKIKALGFQKDPEKYFSQYHFAFVSRYLSILEAFAAKRLVFALYDNPVKEDYLKMAPFAKWIVIEKTPKNLAEKVEYYLQHPIEESKLIDQGYAWVHKQTWNNLCQVYLRLWKD